jgi:putative ABC transport system ATP-binding protein
VYYILYTDIVFIVYISKEEAMSIVFEKVSKSYQMGEMAIQAAKDVSFSIEDGELCVILGPSGAGKTTVLNLLGGMEEASSGKIMFGGLDVTAMTERQLTEYRRHKIGFVFQFYNLIPNLTALENVELAKQACKSPMLPEKALEIVGLKDRLHNFPAQLSGGEQQRVAVARAICKNPDLMLCDEPTGALDTETGKEVLRVLTRISRDMGKTVVIVTHNSLLAPIADRVIEMKNGMVASNACQSSPADLEAIKW